MISRVTKVVLGLAGDDVERPADVVMPPASLSAMFYY